MTDSERFFSRSFQSDDDFWKVRQFLIETYPITPPDLNWEIRRWEGARFHNEDAALDPGWAAQIHKIWRRKPPASAGGGMHLRSFQSTTSTEFKALKYVML